MRLFKVLIFIFIGSCVSYSFKGGSFPEDTKTIYLPFISNQTNMYGIEQTLTNIIRDDFLKDGRLVLKDNNDADLILNLTIQSYSNNVYSYTSNEEVKEYEISIIISATYINNITNDTIWDNKIINAKKTYSAYNENEENGIEYTAKEFSENLISLMTENW